MSDETNEVVLRFPNGVIVTLPAGSEGLDKSQGLQLFWSSFGIPAYDENTVPSDAVMPYITYNMLEDSIGNVLPMSATLHYRTTSWAAITKKAADIGEAISENGHVVMNLKSGYVWITTGTPFSQRIKTENPDIREIYINVTAEFLTAY